MIRLLTAILTTGFLICLVVSISYGQAADPPTMKVGVATVDITPEGPVYMMGFSGRDKDPSTGVYKPIEASCIVFDNGMTRVGIMALDVCKTGVEQLGKVRAAAEAVGVPPEQMMLNCSHSHCGPRVLGNKNAEYMPIFEERIRGLLQAAVADLQPVTLDYTVGSSTMAVNRRQLNAEGKYVGMRPEPRKGIDPDVPVLRAVRPDGTVRAVVLTGMPLAWSGSRLIRTDLTASAVPPSVVSIESTEPTISPL
mgnify:CR=1 FL=1